jgi:PhoH-like ATPase
MKVELTKLMDVATFDTNALIDDPKAPLRQENTLVVIPKIVIEELDKLKTGKDSNVRRMARIASDVIDTISEAHEDKLEMPIGQGSFLIVESGMTDLFKTTEPDKPDNMIISVALGYAKKGHRVVLYSNDRNVRIFARQLAKDEFPDQLSDLPLKARKYEIVDSSLHEIDSGVRDLNLPDMDVNMLRTNGFHSIALPYINGEHIMVRSETNEKNTVLAVWDTRQGKIKTIADYKKGAPVWRIGGDVIGATDVRPRDARQSFLINDILDLSKNLHFVLSRVAGAGKNFITTACALKLLKDQHYDRLIVIKPMISVEGADTGYLPGTKEEKMAPWFESFNDTITELTNDRGLGGDLEARIELDIVTHMRGRSIPRTLMIIDEAQNFSDDALKTLITRAGEGSKIILMGDLSQIDNLRLDAGNTGLRVWAERARNRETGYANSTYILLDSNFRSELSAWASSFYE